jgi:hypothetical protein
MVNTLIDNRTDKTEAITASPHTYNYLIIKPIKPGRESIAKTG